MSENRLTSLKEQFLTLVENQMHNINNVDAKEMGEVIDIIKDLAEANYYCKVTDAMDKNSNGKNIEYIEEYLPETRYYTPRVNMKMNDPRMDNNIRSRMYYTEPTHNANMYDGRSVINRRMYMENIHSPNKMHDFEEYIHSLGDDIVEMVEIMTPEEKSEAKKKVSTLAEKIV